MKYTYNTTLYFRVADEEHDIPCRIEYRVTPGAEAMREEPGYGPTVGVTQMNVKAGHGSFPELPFWMWEALIDESLEAELLENAAATDEYHRDQAADAKREEGMLER